MNLVYIGTKKELNLTRPELKKKYHFKGKEPVEVEASDGIYLKKEFGRSFKEIPSDPAMVKAKAEKDAIDKAEQDAKLRAELKEELRVEMKKETKGTRAPAKPRAAAKPKEPAKEPKEDKDAVLSDMGAEGPGEDPAKK